RHPLSQEENVESLREELDLSDEARDWVILTEVVIKQRMTTKYNKKVSPRRFNIGDLVLRRVDIGLKNAAQGKLAPNWK
ncbi:hypothetical protein A2U01_0079821, partial [Trifolium medium]|nr:hypothetical protein [Trifolium medium]